MSLLSRVRDLVSANLNSMLDGAEDPEKMVNEYMRQLQEQLYEAKTSVASAMADETTLRASSQRGWLGFHGNRSATATARAPGPVGMESPRRQILTSAYSSSDGRRRTSTQLSSGLTIQYSGTPSRA